MGDIKHSIAAKILGFNIIWFYKRTKQCIVGQAENIKHSAHRRRGYIWTVDNACYLVECAAVAHGTVFVDFYQTLKRRRYYHLAVFEIDFFVSPIGISYKIVVSALVKYSCVGIYH